MIGRTLGHYRIEAKLGEGGMGVVYKARDTHLDRLVAIKVLPAEAVANPERKRRFVLEAKAASALNHPNIITIYDIDQADGVDYIAMEYVAGQTLGSIVGRHGLPLRDALRYASEIASALAEAHEAAIVHRDLKPANIMISTKGQVKVLDFGLAKLTEPLESDGQATTQTVQPRTEDGVILGTAAYMSPEQAHGKSVDARSDIFSFGSVLYEMLSGRQPFSGDTKLEVLLAIVQKDPPPLSELAPGTPRELERVVSLALRKEMDRRFQHMADVRVALLALKEESDSGKLAPAAASLAPSGRRWNWIIGAIAALVVAAAGGVLWWTGQQQPERQTLTRLTSDSGLTTDPALSPDGKLLAFASDRSGEGHLDIWVRQVAGGEPIRLTTLKGDDSEPSFSTDGTQIAFRSEGDPNGVYVVPALGGEPRLLARQGRSPRYSPDGRWLAYWVGERHVGLSDIYLVATTGGTPRKLLFGPPLYTPRYPVWSSDGRTLLFQQRLDWWTVSVDTGKTAKSGVFDAFRGRQQPTSIYVIPDDWQQDRILFSARTGDSTALWQIPLSPRSWRPVGAARQLTFGTGLDVIPSAAAGALVFASLAENIDIWSLPADTNQGKPLAGPNRLTQDAAPDIYPSISSDGRRIVFASTRSGSSGIWMRDLETGRETQLTVDPKTRFGFIAADHTRIACQSVDIAGPVQHLLSAGPRGYDSMGEKICEDCGMLSDISSDGSRTLHFEYDPSRHRGTIISLDVRSNEKHLLIDDGSFLADPRFSSDGSWIAFHEIIGLPRPRRQIFIVPVRSGAPVTKNEWISITDGSAMDQLPTFSPDGNLLYFISERDGFRCIVAQRLDMTSKRPAGPTFYVSHFHGAQRSMMHFDNANLSRLSVARDKIVFSLAERTGNIWMTRLPAAK